MLEEKEGGLTYGEGMRITADSYIAILICSMHRSVHNTRIERLWVDVKTQVSGRWSDLFRDLEERHGLDIENLNHIWLMQTLFLPLLNKDLIVFQDAWNNHLVRRSGEEHRSPADLFVMGMFERGVRGYQLPIQQMDQDRAAEGHEMPEALPRARELPQHLNYVEVNSPDLTDERLHILQALTALLDVRQHHSAADLWTEAIVICRRMYPSLF